MAHLFLAPALILLQIVLDRGIGAVGNMRRNVWVNLVSGVPLLLCMMCMADGANDQKVLAGTAVVFTFLRWLIFLARVEIRPVRLMLSTAIWVAVVVGVPALSWAVEACVRGLFADPGLQLMRLNTFAVVGGLATVIALLWMVWSMTGEVVVNDDSQNAGRSFEVVQRPPDASPSAGGDADGGSSGQAGDRG